MSTAEAADHIPVSRARFALVAAAHFGVLTFVFFSGALLSPQLVISWPGLDMERGFYPWRAFVAAQLRSGHLPLWNPYIFGGMPALGNFEYAVLYPPNWLHLILPMSVAMNLLIGMHVMMAGWFTALWCRGRGAGVVASLLGGTIFMFCGPVQMRLTGGCLAHVCAIAWSPLILLCVDAILQQSRFSWKIVLWGAAAVAMQILAGFPQAVYCTFLVAVIYVAITLPAIKHRKQAIAGIFIMYLLAVALSAAQLLPGIAAARESTRVVNASSEMASDFNVPPENLLTVIVSHLYGDDFVSPYAGRGGMWETSLYVGTVGFSLAILGAMRIRSARERATLFTALVIVPIVLGKYTPLFRLLVPIVPGLGLLRGPARFTCLIALLASTLAAGGFDFLWQSRKQGRHALIAGICAIILAIVGYVVWQSADSGAVGLWGRLMLRMEQTGEVWAQLNVKNDPKIVARSAHFAAGQLFGAAGSLAQMAVIFALTLRNRRWNYLLPLVALGQLWVASGTSQAMFRPETAPPSWSDAIASLKPDERILTRDVHLLNLPMELKLQNISGFDPFVPARWANLIAPLLDSDPLRGDVQVQGFHPSPIWSMLRLRTLLPQNERLHLDDPMPRLYLIDNVRLTWSPETSLAAVRDPAFDPWKQVVVEAPGKTFPPDIKPGSDPIGEVQLLHSTNESLEISASLNRAAVLLITDSYSSGWFARSIEPAPKEFYSVWPANYSLRAIHLKAGKHHILLEYSPISVPVGFAISGMALLIWCVAQCAMLFRRTARQM